MDLRTLAQDLLGIAPLFSKRSNGNTETTSRVQIDSVPHIRDRTDVSSIGLQTISDMAKTGGQGPSMSRSTRAKPQPKPQVEPLKSLIQPHVADKRTNL